MLNGYKSYIGLGLIAIGWALGTFGLIDPTLAEDIRGAGMLMYGGGMAHKLSKATSE